MGWLIAVLLLLPLLSAGYKVGVLHYALTDALPDDEYTVTVAMTLDGHNERAKVRTFLPVEDSRQKVMTLTPASSAAFRFSESNERDNRVGNCAQAQATLADLGARFAGSVYVTNTQTYLTANGC